MFGILIITFALIGLWRLLAMISQDRTVALLHTWLAFGTLALVYTEFASLFNAIGRGSCFSFWIMVAFLSWGIPWWRKWHAPCRTRLSWSFENLIPILAVAFFATMILWAALTALPNTFDSMTYHLSRIMHWIQNGTVAHYETNIPRQNELGPLAEYLILHGFLLSQDIITANLVQYAAYLVSLIAVYRLARQLGAKDFAAWVSVAFAATIPMGVLQASNTQNDGVATSYILIAILSLLQLRQSPPAVSWRALLSQTALWAFALACVLGSLTKMTAGLYLFPFCAAFALWPRNWNQAHIKVCGMISAAVILSAVVLGLPYFARNYEATGSPLGTGFGLTNEAQSGWILAKNITRNAALHWNFDNDAVRTHIEEGIRNYFGPIVDLPETTWPGTKFHIPLRFYHEDSDGNPWHFAMLLGAVLILTLGIKRTCVNTWILFWATCVAFVLFCLMLKWQPWHSRLHLPFFWMAAPLIGAAIALLGTNLRLIAGFAVVALGVSYSAPILTRNAMKPLVGASPVYSMSRLDQMFMGMPPLEETYRAAMAIMLVTEPRTVALCLGANDFEYPLWFWKQYHQPDLHIVHECDNPLESPEKYDFYLRSPLAPPLNMPDDYATIPLPNGWEVFYREPAES